MAARRVARRGSDDLVLQLGTTRPSPAPLVAERRKTPSARSDIQKIASRLLKVELGFLEETRFADDAGFLTRARPDFIYRLSNGRGVLAEVERGGTTTNNHDLKDFWKTHIAPDAQHLFLQRTSRRLVNVSSPGPQLEAGVHVRATTGGGRGFNPGSAGQEEKCR